MNKKAVRFYLIIGASIGLVCFIGIQLKLAGKQSVEAASQRRQIAANKLGNLNLEPETALDRVREVLPGYERGKGSFDVIDATEWSFGDGLIDVTVFSPTGQMVSMNITKEFQGTLCGMRMTDTPETAMSALQRYPHVGAVDMTHSSVARTVKAQIGFYDVSYEYFDHESPQMSRNMRITDRRYTLESIPK